MFCIGIIYKSNCTQGVNHAVLIVGVGIDTVVRNRQKEKVPYYIIKNRLKIIPPSDTQWLF